MVAKKKSKKQTKSATTAHKKVTLTKKKTARKKLTFKAKKTQRTAAKKSSMKAAPATQASGRKTTAKKPARAPRKQLRKGTQGAQTAFLRERMEPGSGGQSGDLQGLSRSERADSESVDELLEEGNAFEADVVRGVEDADDSDEREVRTHEVPEDDVPDEYLES